MDIRVDGEGDGVLATATLAHIQCCLCATPIPPNPAAMCANCLKSQVDITEGITKQLTVMWCRNCGRYQSKLSWQNVAPESRELLALLLSKVRGISKDHRLTDVDFVYTESHSKRLKLKITVQQEVFKGAIIQQAFVVEYIVAGLQCADCAQSFTEHVWSAVCQVRQQIKYKKTFLYLEQLLIKHNICANSIGVKQIPGGLDFYWGHPSKAVSMVSFLRGVVPIQTKESRKLISEDFSSNTKKFKYSLLAEIVPICRFDLVHVPKKVAHKLGGCSQLQLCYRVTSNVHLIDPTTLRVLPVDAKTYFRHPFQSIATERQLVKYEVLDVVKSENSRPELYHGKMAPKKFELCEVTVARSTDMKEFTTMSHLGYFIEPGMVFMGYPVHDMDLQFHNGGADAKVEEWPEVILVKRYYNKKARKRNRKWKLKRLNIEQEDIMRPRDLDLQEKENETFLQDLEEDAEMRSKINLYKDENYIETKGMEVEEDSEEDPEDNVPDVEMETLLELEAMTIDPALAELEITEEARNAKTEMAHMLVALDEVKMNAKFNQDLE